MTPQWHHFSSFVNQQAVNLFYLLSHLTSSIICSIALLDYEATSINDFFNGLNVPVRVPVNVIYACGSV